MDSTIHNFNSLARTISVLTSSSKSRTFLICIEHPVVMEPKVKCEVLGTSLYICCLFIFRLLHMSKEKITLTFGASNFISLYANALV